MGESTQAVNLADALRAARNAEALHQESLTLIRDAESLRLAVLRDELAAYVAGNDAARAFFALSILPGEKPRLWLDLVHWVEMAPDPRSYRLIGDRETGRESLLETQDRAEMARFIKTWMAHRLVERARMLARPLAAQPVQGYSTGALILAAISGFSIGVLALFAAGVAIARLW
jgi:hypothetical protein